MRRLSPLPSWYIGKKDLAQPRTEHDSIALSDKVRAEQYLVSNVQSMPSSICM